ncbi:NAD(P)/FAD-dependent oxidoreductase [Peptacetobacter sp.]|uniref:NAD(P)/FAD-dependent oxidoreductase n=1 Tax=Peptacetobacter sp. TaxID=2991975 RepID=UPI002E777E89|nr:FAD-dependent oxidoreductase [Peptacetobacter sp.]MEE0452256.1 FAD-dependent oxidoreductase [Peptacetobacter sp.]
MYDIVIIGAGPAGVSAGIYAKSRGKKVLIIEKEKIGGLIGKVSTVTHYAGIVTGETGVSFSERLKEQAENAGIEIVYEDVNNVDFKGDVKLVFTNNNTYETKKIIIANGTRARKLGIEGELELAGKGIGLNAAKDGKDYIGKNVYVVGGADGAVKEALYLSQFAKSVTIIHFEDSLGCIAEFREKIKKTSNIDVRLGSRLHAVYGKERVESLDISDEKTGSIETISDPGCGVFVYAGTVPNTELYTDLKLENGFIPVDEKMETEIKGVYAVGDIRVKPVRQVATAVADGTIAAINASM